MASAMIATIRTTGKPIPLACDFGWGKAAWLRGVSGIDAVVPSTRSTRRPFQSQSGAAPASISRPVRRTRYCTTPRGSRSRASQ